MPKISALTAGGALAGTEVVPVVQAGSTVKSTIDDIATRVIASDAELAAIAGLTSAADRGLYFTGSGTASLFTFTAAGRAILDDADAAAQRTTLGFSANGSSLVTAANYAAMRGLLDLEAGTDFNAYSALLADIAGITFAQGDVIYYNGTNLVKLAAGTSGHFLKTQGAGANPVWDAAGGGGTIGGSTGATDNAILRADGVGGATVQSSALTIDDTGIIGFPDDVRQTFNPGANAAGLNVGSIAGDPGTPSNGDLWYDSTANELTARINGANVALGAGGSSGISINSQSGTTYTVVSGDLAKLVIFTNASNVAVTLPQATGSFAAPWYAYFINNGGGTVTITPTTSTVGGNTAVKLVPSAAVLLVSDGTNYQVVPQAAFYGGAGVTSLSLQKPDAAATGGNARGNNAVDLQTSRSAAAQVASGDNSFVAGRRNTASNGGAVAMGDTNTASGIYAIALGQSNTASNTGAFAHGLSNTASGYASQASGESVTAANDYSFAHGYSIAGVGQRSAVFGFLGHGNSNVSQFTWAAGETGVTSQGSAQSRKNILLVYTTGSAAVRLTATGAAASSTNVMNLPNNTSVTFTATVIIRDLSNGNTNTYTIGPSLITRGANAASTAVSAGNPAVTVGPTTGTALTLAANPTFTADTTNGGINVSYTPPVGNTNAILAVCVIESVEVHS